MIQYPKEFLERLPSICVNFIRTPPKYKEAYKTPINTKFLEYLRGDYIFILNSKSKIIYDVINKSELPILVNIKEVTYQYLLRSTSEFYISDSYKNRKDFIKDHNMDREFMEVNKALGEIHYTNIFGEERVIYNICFTVGKWIRKGYNELSYYSDDYGDQKVILVPCD